jgi:2,5-furandicarboxylate decarboxylase 1
MKSEHTIKSLQSFLDDVRGLDPGYLLNVEEELDPRFEISALLVKLDRAHKFPIVMFRRAKDIHGKPSRFPLLSNLFASRRLCALALEPTVE